MPVVARWGLAIAVSAGAFAASWWVCQERAGLDEGAALAVAGAVLAVVLAVAGWWAAREPSYGAGIAVGAHEREAVSVEIRQGSLWVGTEAYPLGNIARAYTIKLVPRRGAAAVGRYVMVVMLWVFLGAVAAIAIRAAAVVVVAAIVVLALIAISTIRLIGTLSAQPYYELVIETAGTPRALVRSANAPTLNYLANMIMLAIDDPDVRIYLPPESFEEPRGGEEHNEQ